MEKMRLTEFIRANTKVIADEWEKFAGTLLPEEVFKASVLRNSIEKILEIIANDMDQPQNKEQQISKSQGKTSSKAIEKISEEHVLDRIKMGLSSQQLIAEFRALRASVIRLWRKNKDTVDLKDVDDLIRFNEVVDETITEAETRYSGKIDQSRGLFLGILGHDLRNPLGAISGSADLILRTPNHARNAMLAKQILASVNRMSHLITDLIELTRVKLGDGISLNCAKINLQELCQKAIDEMHAIHPERVFRLEAEYELVGDWDDLKLNQVLSNLLGNAVQHGSPTSEITLKAKKAGDWVELQVHNEGPVIPKKLLPKLFDRFVQEKSESSNENVSGSMGLGLFIAKEIIVAHGGTIKANSSKEEGTTFCACLPYNAPR